MLKFLQNLNSLDQCVEADIRQGDTLAKVALRYNVPISELKRVNNLLNDGKLKLALLKVSQKFGVEEQEIHSALLSDDPHNQLVIAYNLIIDNKRIQTAKEEDDFKEFFSGSPSSLGQDSMTARPHPERIMAPLRDKPVTPVTAKTHRGAPIKRSKWHLGIRSQSKPHDIMSEVYRAMKTLDFEWKVINPYHVQVLSIVNQCQLKA